MNRPLSFVFSLLTLASCYATTRFEDRNRDSITDADTKPNSDGFTVRHADSTVIDRYTSPDVKTGIDEHTNSDASAETDAEKDTEIDPIQKDFASGIFDPYEIYILGTLMESACYRNTISRLSDPNTAIVGSDCYFAGGDAMIRPDGVLLYYNVFEGLLREFHCDDCPGWTDGNPYPEDVLDNDTILSTPCETEPLVPRFVIGIEGYLLYRCGNAWYTEDGKELPIDGQILSYGYNGAVLFLKETDLSIYYIEDDEEIALEVPEIDLNSNGFVSRVDGERGFLLAMVKEGVTSLYSIAYTGSAAQEGIYPDANESHDVMYNSAFPIRNAVLDAFGGLFQIATDRETQHRDDIIIYRTIVGNYEVVYSETTDPLVKLHMSSITTGP